MVALEDARGEKGTGTTGGPLLALPVGARSLGMGNAYVAVADDASSNTWNPAGLAQILSGKIHVQTTYQRHIGDTRLGYILVGHKIKSVGSLGFTLATLQTGRVEFYDPSGNRKEVPGEEDYLLGLAYARDLPMGIQIGAGLKYLDSSLGGSVRANTIAADFGGRINPSFLPWLTGAVVIQNAFGKQKFIEKAVPVRSIVRGGIAVKQNLLRRLEIIVALDGNTALSEKKIRFNGGMELTYTLSGTDLRPSIRAGYPIGYDLTGIQVGLGLAKGNIHLDYGLGREGILGFVHRLTFGLQLNVKTKETPRDNELEKLDIKNLGTQTSQSDIEASEYFRWGNIYLKEGKYAEAIEYYRAGLDLVSDDATAWRGLGTAYYQEGQYEEARRALKRALSLNPGDETLREWLEDWEER